MKALLVTTQTEAAHVISQHLETQGFIVDVARNPI